MSGPLTEDTGPEPADPPTSADRAGAPAPAGTGTARAGSAERPAAGPGPGEPAADLAGRLAAFGRRVRGGELGALPVVVALAVIWGVFQSLNGAFLSPNDLSTIALDTVGTGTIAVGVVFVLLLGEIDLSVSYVSGLAGAVFAVLSVDHGVPEGAALALALLTGTAIGAVQGFFFAVVGVPAFVVTLAGFLAWNGAMLWVLGHDGTINLPENGLLYTLYDETFADLAVGYGVALAAVLLYLGASLRQARRRRAAGLPHRAPPEIAVRTAALAVPAFAAAFVLNRSAGLPLALLLFLALLAGSDFVVRRTAYGRRVLAVGGGVEAARRAGVDVTRVRVTVFMTAGTLAAAGGMFLAGQVNSAQSTQGGGNTLMDAIAAAVIGGTSLFGGRGSTWSALLGALVIVSIQQGMYLLDLNTAIQYMITGAVLLAAVVVDSVSRRTQRAAGRA